MLAYNDGARVRLISRQGLDHTASFHLLGEPNPAELCTPPTLIAFDVLQVGHRDVRPLPLSRRRAMLEDRLGAVNLVLPVRRLDGRLAVRVAAAPNA